MSSQDICRDGGSSRVAGDHDLATVIATLELDDRCSDGVSIPGVVVVARRQAPHSLRHISFWVGVAGPQQSNSNDVPTGRRLSSEVILIVGFIARRIAMEDDQQDRLPSNLSNR